MGTKDLGRNCTPTYFIWNIVEGSLEIHKNTEAGGLLSAGWHIQSMGNILWTIWFVLYVKPSSGKRLELSTSSFHISNVEQEIEVVQKPGLRLQHWNFYILQSAACCEETVEDQSVVFKCKIKEQVRLCLLQLHSSLHYVTCGLEALPALNQWDFSSSWGEGRRCAGRSISSSAVRAQRLLHSITTHNAPGTDLNYFSSAIIPKVPEVLGSRKKEINEKGGRGKLRDSDVTDVGKLWLSRGRRGRRGRRKVSWAEMFSCWIRTLKVKEVRVWLRCVLHWNLVSLLTSQFSDVSSKTLNEFCCRNWNQLWFILVLNEFRVNVQL